MSEREWHRAWAAYWATLDERGAEPDQTAARCAALEAALGAPSQPTQEAILESPTTGRKWGVSIDTIGGQEYVYVTELESGAPFQGTSDGGVVREREQQVATVLGVLHNRVTVPGSTIPRLAGLIVDALASRSGEVRSDGR